MKEITLKHGYVTLVDDEDYERVISEGWRAGKVDKKRVYVMKGCSHNGKYRLLYLHRVLVNAPKGMYVDHIDGNTLNNQRANLRICTNGENIQNTQAPRSNNTSGYTGVTYHKRSRKWVAQINHDGKAVYIGSFDDPREAAIARDLKAIEFHGEFAYLNFPELRDMHT